MVQSVPIPAACQLAATQHDADFADAYEVLVPASARTATEIYRAITRRTPGWVDKLMWLRNRVVQPFGLKNLGELSEIHPAKPDADYQPGDRVGIFTLFENTPDEVLLGDRDKHLDVVLSVFKTVSPDGRSAQVTVTTVVHTHNAWGRLYMLPVAPMHKLIVPAVLKAIGHPARA